MRLARAKEGNPAARGDGFTVVELMVATLLLSAVLLAATQILFSTLDAIQRVDDGTYPEKVGESILRTFIRDIQAAVAPRYETLFFLVESEGSEEDARDAIHFTTMADPVRRELFDEITGELRGSGITSVSYVLGPSRTDSRAQVLFRREATEWDEDPFEGGTYYEVYTRVRSLRIECWDGIQWFDGWNSEERLFTYEEERALMEAAQAQGLPADATGQPTAGGTRAGTTPAANTPGGSTPTGRSLQPGMEAESVSLESLLGIPEVEVPETGLPRAVRIVLRIYIGDEKGLREDERGQLVEREFSVTVPIVTAEALPMKVQDQLLTSAGGVAGMAGPDGTVLSATGDLTSGGRPGEGKELPDGIKRLIERAGGPEAARKMMGRGSGIEGRMRSGGRLPAGVQGPSGPRGRGGAAGPGTGTGGAPLRSTGTGKGFRSR